MSRPWPPWAGGLAIVTAAVIVAGGVVLLRVAPDRPGSAEGRPSTTLPVVVTPSALPEGVDLVGPPGTESSLPALPTALPSDIRLDSPVPLSADPVRRALALFRVGRFDGATNVLVLGDDGRARRLDLVALEPTGDPEGNLHSAVTEFTLSPDGRWAAFPQRDRLVLVDLSTPSVESLAVPGFNEYVAWLGDRVLVAGNAATVLVDPASRAVTAVPYSQRVAASATVDATVVELSGGLSAPLALRVWTDGAYRDIVLAGLPAGKLWTTRGVRHGATVAGTLNPAPTERGRTIVALDADTASVRRQLLVSEPRNHFTVVLGCLDEHTVLVWRGDTGSIAAAGWVLAWNVESGDISRVAQVTGDQPVVTVSIGPVGK